MRARTITDGMALAAAGEIARFAEEGGLGPERILPRMDEWEVFPRVATAVGLRAQEEGVAGLALTRDQLRTGATRKIVEAQRLAKTLVREGIIPAVPPS